MAESILIHMMSKAQRDDKGELYIILMDDGKEERLYFSDLLSGEKFDVEKAFKEGLITRTSFSVLFRHLENPIESDEDLAFIDALIRCLDKKTVAKVISPYNGLPVAHSILKSNVTPKHLEIIDYLIKECDMDLNIVRHTKGPNGKFISPSSNGYTLLDWVICHTDIDAVSYLLDRGADPHRIDIVKQSINEILLKGEGIYEQMSTNIFSPSHEQYQQLDKIYDMLQTAKPKTTHNKITSDVTELIYKGTVLDALFYSETYHLKQFYDIYKHMIETLFESFDTEVFKLTSDKTFIEKRNKELSSFLDRYLSMGCCDEQADKRPQFIKYYGLYPRFTIVILNEHGVIYQFEDLFVSSDGNLSVKHLKVTLHDPIDHHMTRNVILDYDSRGNFRAEYPDLRTVEIISYH